LELRKTGDYDMNTGAASTHDNEGLSCCPICKSFITNVFPFDGETLHLQKTHNPVTSTGSLEKYVFDWDEWMWQRNPDMTDYRPFQPRLASVVVDVEDHDEHTWDQASQASIRPPLDLLAKFENVELACACLIG
jgi:hypothetical protein